MIYLPLERAEHRRVLNVELALQRLLDRPSAVPHPQLVCALEELRVTIAVDE